MDFEEANSQVDSLCGALPRDDLRMHKVWHEMYGPFAC